MELGVISDTHGYLDPKIPRLFAGVGHILHGGDIGLPWLILELEQIAPVTAVLGNNDTGLDLRETELAELEGASPLPVVIAGDVNAVAAAFTSAGFGDAWTIAHPKDAGFTCCQPGDLRNVVSALTQRIDFVLMKGGFGVDGIDRIGVRTADRTASGLWPSDHAGLAAVLTIP